MARPFLFALPGSQARSNSEGFAFSSYGEDVPVRSLSKILSEA